MSADSLARQVHRRRTQLGISQGEASALGGPSHSSLSQIENASRPNLTRTMFLKLDRFLSWPAGTAERIYAAPDGEGDELVVGDEAGSWHGLTGARAQLIEDLAEQLRIIERMLGQLGDD